MSSFPRGAKPNPRHRLLSISPHTVLQTPPPQFAVVPPQLSMWDNDKDGCCVTTEEAFGKAVYSIICGLPELFVPVQEVVRFASKHGFLNGATLTDVMDVMKSSDGLSVNGTLYHNGAYTGVDYSNEIVLQSAISTGPVKVAIDADALPSGAGKQQGWFSTSNQHYGNTDHCISFCGYGRADYLYQQLKVPLPANLPANTPGFLAFTWSTIGFVTRDWVLGTVVEGYVRTPTTVGQAPASTAIVPGLVGGTWNSCKQALTNVGLVISPATTIDPNARVITQSPTQQTTVPVGSTVVVTMANTVHINVSLPGTTPGTVGTATVV